MPVKKLPHQLIPRFTKEEIQKLPRHPITVLVHNVRSLFNVGSVFRTSDAAGIKELILCGYTGYPPRKEIEKTALGSTESVAWQYQPNIKEKIVELKAKGVRICALEITDTPKKFSNLSVNDFPLAMIIGNEVTGVDDDLLELCDFALEIPQFGMKHSMNVSVAYGIGVYLLVEKYRELHPSDAPPAPTVPLPFDSEDEID